MAFMCPWTTFLPRLGRGVSVFYDGQRLLEERAPLPCLYNTEVAVSSSKALG